MIQNSGPIVSRVRLRNFRSANPEVTTQLLGKLVHRRAGVLGRLLPKGPTDLVFRLFEDSLKFDQSRTMKIGTKGSLGIALKKGALAGLVQNIVLESDHVAIEHDGTFANLRVLGQESVLVARRNNFQDSFQLFELTRASEASQQIGQEFELRLLERTDAKTYSVNTHFIQQVEANGKRNFLVQAEKQNQESKGFSLRPNDTIFLPLGYTGEPGEPLLWLRLIYEPPLESQPAQGARTAPLKVMVEGSDRPVLLQELQPEQQLDALRKLNIEGVNLLPSQDRDSVEDVAVGLAAFPGMQGDAVNKAVAARLARQAADGELVHSLGEVRPSALASPTELAKTQIDPVIRTRSDVRELLQTIETLRKNESSDNYLNLVPPGFHGIVLDLAEQAFSSGFTVGEAELDRQFVWDIFALNWLLRYSAYSRIAQEKGYSQRVASVVAGTRALFAFTDTGSFVEIVPDTAVGQGGPPFVKVQIDRINGRSDAFSRQFQGLPLTDTRLKQPIELATRSETEFERTAPVVFLSTF